MAERYIYLLSNTIQGIWNNFTGYILDATLSLYPWDCFSVVGICLFFTFIFLSVLSRQSHAYDQELGKGIIEKVFPKSALLSRRMLQDLLLSFGILLMFGVYLYFQIPITAHGVSMRVLQWASSFLHLKIGPIEFKEHGYLIDFSYAFFLFLLMEFGHWVYHFLSHKIPFLWELHKVHHAPSTMSPATDYRLHPLDYTLIFFTQGFFVGLGTLAFTLVFGFNSVGQDSRFVMMCFLVFLYLPATLHHSFRWWAWGRLEWFILSPACHTLHHSVDPREYNSNYGLRLTIFDHLFGTFCKPGKTPPPGFRIGLSNDTYDWDHAPYWRLLFDPMKKSFSTLIPKRAFSQIARAQLPPKTQGIEDNPSDLPGGNPGTQVPDRRNPGDR